jgi:hypothetical protein
MNRILIDTPTFQAILDKHPEIEVELLNTVVPQLAETVRKKVEEREGNWTAQIQKAIGRLESELGSRWKFPDAAKSVIHQFLRDELLKSIKLFAKEEAEKVAKAAAETTITKSIADARRQIAIEEEAAQARLDVYAKAAAETHVMALLRAGKLTVVP